MPGLHSLISPSALADTELCPGRPAAIAGLPAELLDVPSIHADTGTAVHEVIAYCAENPDYTPQQFVGHRITVKHSAPHPDAQIPFTQDMAMNAQMALTYYGERSQEYGVPAAIETRVYPGRSLHLPVNGGVPQPMAPFLKSKGIDPDGLCFGTADAGWDGSGFLEVADYKNGRKYVDERQNLQTTAYALGFMAEHNLETQGPIQRVRTTIIQPNSDGQRVRTYEYKGLDELMDMSVRIGTIVNAALDPNAPRVPGDKQCHFCEFKTQCPEHAEWAGTVLEKALGTTTTVLPQETPMLDPFGTPPPANDLAPPVSPAPQALASTIVDALKGDTDSMTLEARVAVMEAAPMLRSWLSAIEDGLLQEALAGVNIPGHKVVAGRGSRAWAEGEDAVLKKFKNASRKGPDGKAAGKLKVAEFTESKVISPAQAEKRIKPLVSDKVWDGIAGLIESKPGKPTLVPSTDNRPPIRESVENTWGDLTPLVESTAAAVGDDDDEPPNPLNAAPHDPELGARVPTTEEGFDPFG